MLRKRTLQQLEDTCLIYWEDTQADVNWISPVLNLARERIFHLHSNVIQPCLQVVGVFIPLLIKHSELHSHVFIFDLPKVLSATKTGVRAPSNVLCWPETQAFRPGFRSANHSYPWGDGAVRAGRTFLMKGCISPATLGAAPSASAHFGCELGSQVLPLGWWEHWSAVGIPPKIFKFSSYVSVNT